MMTSKKEVRLSGDESQYISDLLVQDQSFAELVRRHPSISIADRAVTLDHAGAETLREYFTEKLARIGFDASYQPNQEGVTLEKLIDAFFFSE